MGIYDVMSILLMHGIWHFAGTTDGMVVICCKASAGCFRITTKNGGKVFARYYTDKSYEMCKEQYEEIAKNEKTGCLISVELMEMITIAASKQNMVVDIVSAIRGLR